MARCTPGVCSGGDAYGPYYRHFMNSSVLQRKILSVSVEVERETSIERDGLVRFLATVMWAGPGGDQEPRGVGSLTGWISRGLDGEFLWDLCDELSADAECVGAIAREILNPNEDFFVMDVLLVDRMFLEPSWRGRRLTGALVEEIMDLLGLNRDMSAVVLCPEPQSKRGGPFDLGPERDEAMQRLRLAYEASGFRQWGESSCWWLPPEGVQLSE
ncbi:Hypothetical protein PFR_JS13-1_296 [Propionibacterium freudenreichii]|nr:Hypothetical protein PFR_JS11_296 [Propionibacterium freudenreichii]SCQ47492.1 Hypothetical protein PFR_JS13-1_296 [Propionibacterium freudenreichii]